VEKQKKTETKAFKARNEYILSIDASNACIKKFCTEDIGDLVDCMDFGFHASVVHEFTCICQLKRTQNVHANKQ
jgi:hypothetical protein